MANPRVVVSGVGLTTSLGTGTEETWDGLVNGRTGIGPIEAFDASTLLANSAGEVRDLEPKDFAHRKTLRSMTRNDVLALAGATLALRHAGVEEVADGASEDELVAAAESAFRANWRLLDGV